MKTELTMEQELKLIELEMKNLEFLYKSYVDSGPNMHSEDPRIHYTRIAHSETRRMLDNFYKKWKVEKL